MDGRHSSFLPRQSGQDHPSYIDEPTPAFYSRQVAYSQPTTSSLYPSTDQYGRSSSLETDDGAYYEHRQPYQGHPPSLAESSRAKQSVHELSSSSTAAHSILEEPSKAQSAGKSGKSRRERPRIKLAANQPSTTQGKARERVYVACVQCRTRKIRCDGDKPACYNCTRRPQTEEPCCYDNNPKRRGPDKVPGARQRMVREFRTQLEEAQDSQPRKRRRRRPKDKDSSVDAPKETPLSHVLPEERPAPGAPTLQPVIQTQSSVTPAIHHTTDSHLNSSITPGYYAEYGQSELPLEPPEPFTETEAQYQYRPPSSDPAQVTRAASLLSGGDLSVSPNGYSPLQVSPLEEFSHQTYHTSIRYHHLAPSPQQTPSSFVEDYPAQTSSYRAHAISAHDTTTTSLFVSENTAQPYYPPDHRNQATRPATRHISPAHLSRHDHLASVPISASVTQRLSHSVSPVSTTYVVRNFAHNDQKHAIDSGTSKQEQYDVHPAPSYGYITEIDENDDGEGGEAMYSRPSHQFTRQVWWDSLLSLYHDPFSNHLVPLSTTRRNQVASEIVNDLKFIFRASNYWFSFFHVPRFFATYHNPRTRSNIQPALILMLITMSIFFRSSEREGGAAGREKALRFRDHAQAALEASFNSGWIDETLAQAAFLLAMFEGCCHAQHSSLRVASALTYLDSIIRSLNLTYLDVDKPEASQFDQRTVPHIESRQPLSPQASWQFHYQNATAVSTHPHQAHAGVPTDRRCVCQSLTLGATQPGAHEFAPLWLATPGWNPDWNDGEIRQESIRRVCWTTMVLAANDLNYWASMPRSSHPPSSLFVAEPANYSLLFPGESLVPDSLMGISSKDTVWALYDRAFILWHGCNNMRNDMTRSHDEKTRFAMLAWHAADSIEEALNNHTCDLEKAFLYQGREYLFNTRMNLSFDFQKNIPIVAPAVNELKAMEWLQRQQDNARRFIELSSLVAMRNAVLSRRPFFVFWFMAQSSRALGLWEQNRSMTLALEVCKDLLPPIDYLTELWPCASQRNTLFNLRIRIENACRVAGIVSPPPAPLSSLPL